MTLKQSHRTFKKQNEEYFVKRLCSTERKLSLNEKGGSKKRKCEEFIAARIQEN